MSSHHSVFAYLLLISASTLISGIPPMDVTYDELEKLNVTCNNINSCQKRVDTAFYDLTKGFSCHCGSFCSELGTCCLDSPFRDKNRTRDVATCRRVSGRNERNYFVIDKCTPNDKTNDAFQNLCEGEQDTKGDLMSRVPVTSVTSNLTYKNYFCFRCHETNAEYFSWNVEMTAELPFQNTQEKEIIPSYNEVQRTWLAPVKGDDILYPVEISIAVPKKIIKLPRMCFPNLISNCSDDWPEDEIRQKCGMYMSVTYIIEGYSVKRYRNPHCALCNYRNLDENACEYDFPSSPPPTESTDTIEFSTTDFVTWGPPTRTPFSFTHLLDINPYGGPRVGQIESCGGSSAWDPYYKKCRKLFCNIPGYIIINMKCVPP